MLNEEKDRWDSITQAMDGMKLTAEVREKYAENIRRKDLKKMSISEFSTIAVIGRGAFGEVKLVRKNDTGVVYAAKTMSKADMVRQGQVQHIRAERDVLALADNPWVVKLHFSFQDSVNLHLVMEYLPGGDLMSILMKYDILSHEVTKFYMAELALAVHSVHQLNYFHRDLKPDNVLVDSTGHIKLSDFGLCKAMDSPVPYNEPEPSEEAQDDFKNQHETASKRKAWQARSRALSYSVVGTPEYIAPEVFAKRGYDEKCDWWSLGVIMYECLIGYPPFYADTPRATVWKIVNWKRSLKFPDDVALSADAKDCILRLICSPSHRMTFEELQVHPFFAGIDWNSMRRAEAPIIPKLSGDADTSCFDNFEDTPRHPVSPKAAAALAAASSSFDGYSYRRPEEQAPPPKAAFEPDSFFQGIDEVDCDQ